MRHPPPCPYDSDILAGCSPETDICTCPGSRLNIRYSYSSDERLCFIGALIFLCGGLLLAVAGIIRGLHQAYHG